MNVIIHPQTPYSAACLIAWALGANLVTVQKGKGYVSYIQERKHDDKTKVIHTAHVHTAPAALDAA